MRLRVKLFFFANKATNVVGKNLEELPLGNMIEFEEQRVVHHRAVQVLRAEKSDRIAYVRTNLHCVSFVSVRQLSLDGYS